MRITIVQGAFFPVPPLMGGAVEKVWDELGQEFARRGHAVTHISRCFPGLPDRDERGGVQHVRVPGFDAPRSLLALKLRDLLYSFRVRRSLPVSDILVTNTFWLPILQRSARRGRIYVHVARYPKKQMRFYAHAARLQTVSKHIAEAICTEVPALSAKVHTIPYPLPAAWQSTTRSSAPREKAVLFVGRIHPEKGIALLLQACAQMAQFQRREWKLWMVGPAEAKHGGGGVEFLGEMEAIAAPIQSQIEWTGPVFDPAQLRDRYQRASLFVYPSLAEFGETFGLAPLEAMASGCPPLVSDLACFQDYLTDSETGFVFDHRSPDPGAGLARRLGGLLDDSTTLRRVAEAGESKAREYSLERIASLYLEDFTSLVSAGEPT
jgi:glycosyltransferase involved in cell wall biosynthesis